jgi:transposase
MCDSLFGPQDVGAAMVWRQGKSYSQDLRARVLAAVDGGMAARSAASVFRVSVSYIYKALTRRRRTGEASASSRRGHRPRKLTPAQETALAAHITAHADITLATLQTWLLSEHGVWLSNGALWSAVERLGLSFKKRHCGPPNRTVRMSPPGAASGGRRSPLSIPTSSSSSTRPALPPR